MSNEISGIWVSKKEKRKIKKSLYCMCPRCKTVFILTPKHHVESHKGIIRNCPWCKSSLNWRYHTISKFLYHLLEEKRRDKVQ